MRFMAEGLASPLRLRHNRPEGVPMPDGDAIGDASGHRPGLAVAAASAGRAPVDGSGHSQERACLNCGAGLVGDYCHDCGQKAHVHRTLGAFFHDLAHGVLHFEGRIWRTLPMLVGRPGELTRRYVEGERARFVSPIALFLFAAFLMFAVVSIADPLGGDLGIGRSLDQGIAQERDKLRNLETERRTAGRANAQVERRIAETRKDLARLEDLRSKGMASTTFDDGVRVRGGSLLQAAYRKAIQNPELLIYKLKTNAYKFSWALIPLSVPFVWLLFPFSRRFGLYDHTVFVTYSLSFMTLLVVISILFSLAGLGAIASFALFLPPIHMFAQLKGAYRLGSWSAAWRTLLLVSFAFTAVTLFSLLLVLLGAFD